MKTKKEVARGVATSEGCFYLEYSQQALIETVKVSSWLFSQRVIVKSCAKDLHPQECKDTHEQK